ncbi:molybdate ABC transporter substrate-binding protein [Candidatus Binatia bacterium]|jgi:molybdate transport system substrate-binding protein|nr:molybdate ABC transporter substrate-binding protein [Candidatus Binatia bacterium]
MITDQPSDRRRKQTSSCPHGHARAGRVYPRRSRAMLLCAALLQCTTFATPVAAAELTVSGAASLTAAFGEIATAFGNAHPGATVRTNFAGSSTLVQQIREGAPVDVFASADESNMQKLVDAHDVAGEPVIFARNRLAILVARGNPKKIAGIADLAQPGLIVSLCGPAVPAGKYAREIFAKAGVAVPESSQELDVKAVVSRVSLGEADAGVAYVTDARAADDRVDAVAIPDALNVVARYPIAVLARTRQPDLARDFVAFVRGGEGQAILARFGFLPP